MKREEEIRKEIDLQLAGCFGNYSEGYEKGFIEGAKWADKTMIDKACRWMKDEISNYVSYDGEIDKELITDFKKAMEV